ncbi:uncharacterized protein RHIMIDRAFT_233280 [Rhizopus microsporus ATCC 52813]|uniref:Uncharacterized protein n=1 Tax=Rhizopus microsporus ATCC 52813 TaxID=1340429 RepID=A0A2G4TA22_RHIZD|nr:uncharacterized protein RHIMIDRAFT_233280 [Rhizopus microsporus ATCC 52813]PHZ17859.1 hypothetical protein RHIMIDRAFT_233280 [Rhizopus microsporus ATCC 52813]
MDRFKFHLKLYIRYSDLQDASKEAQLTEQGFEASSFMQLPKAYKVHAPEIDYKSDDRPL